MHNTIPAQELSSRWDRCRTLLQQSIPESQGVFIFSRLNIYYFTGAFANGVLWLPLEGSPTLFCRRGAERAQRETPLQDIYTFSSYREIDSMLTDLNRPLPSLVAAEMNGLSWTLSKSLLKHLPNQQFVAADTVISRCRAQKSAWERTILREAGARHARCLTELLPAHLHAGISELEISHTLSDLLFSQGHLGILRMGNYGEEVFLGHVSVGESANYPSVFNGPVGLKGVHPAAPFMGSAEVKWTEGKPLIIDIGFTLDGYMTDKTQVYWLGDVQEMPERAVRAHAFCSNLQTQIAGMLKPGTLPSAIWKQCLTEVAGSEWSAGFMGHGANKVLFVGHGIGLAIDEYPVLAQGFDFPLEEGMVIAVEPKIGLPGFGMMGVENTFEVTSEGGKCLTGDHFEILTI